VKRRLTWHLHPAFSAGCAPPAHLLFSCPEPVPSAESVVLAAVPWMRTGAAHQTCSISPLRLQTLNDGRAIEGGRIEIIPKQQRQCLWTTVRRYCTFPNKSCRTPVLHHKANRSLSGRKLHKTGIQIVVHALFEIMDRNNVVEMLQSEARIA